VPLVKKYIPVILVVVVSCVIAYAIATYQANSENDRFLADLTIGYLNADLKLVERLRNEDVSVEVLDAAERNVYSKLLFSLALKPNPETFKGEARRGFCRALELNARGALFEVVEDDFLSVVEEELRVHEKVSKSSLHSEYNFEEGADCDF